MKFIGQSLLHQLKERIFKYITREGGVVTDSDAHEWNTSVIVPTDVENYLEYRYKLTDHPAYEFEYPDLAYFVFESGYWRRIYASDLDGHGSATLIGNSSPVYIDDDPIAYALPAYHYDCESVCISKPTLRDFAKLAANHPDIVNEFLSISQQSYESFIEAGLYLSGEYKDIMGVDKVAIGWYDDMPATGNESPYMTYKTLEVNPHINIYSPSGKIDVSRESLLGTLEEGEIYTDNLTVSNFIKFGENATFGENVYESMSESQLLDLNSSSVVAYSDDTAPKIFKFGDVVNLVGAVKVKSTISSGNSVVVGYLSAGFKPAYEIIHLCQGSGNELFLLKVLKNGNVEISRYRNGSGTNVDITTSKWLPFNVTWVRNFYN